MILGIVSKLLIIILC